jgi:hypothetical protein
VARPVLALLMALSLGFAVVSPADAAASDDAPAAVLGLDTTARAQGEQLTDALRRAFAARGASGPTADLVELRLGLGCVGDSPSCLAKGGEALGVRRLIYGHLHVEDEGYRLEIAMLEVETAALITELSMSIGRDELLPSTIDVTAQRVAAQMLPEQAASPSMQSPTHASSSDAPPPAPAAEPMRESGLVWGPYRPRPVWKWAGLGVSAVLTGAFVGATIGLHRRLQGPLRDELHTAADESLTDGNRSNDIDRSMVGNICDAAQATPPGFPSQDDQGRPIVTNERVVRVCNKAEGIRVAGMATMGFAVASAASTVVFSTLLFVRRAGSTSRAHRARRTRWGLDPSLDGVALTLAGSF